MKSQKNFIKNINNNLTLIKVISNPNLHNSMINNYWRKYEGGNRVYSTNFFTPEVMSNVLQLLTENKSINKIAEIINFSAKAIRNNLKICLYYENYWVDEEGKKIKNLKKHKGKKYRLAYYSFKKWLANFRRYCFVKKLICLEQSKKRFKLFFQWFNDKIDNLIKSVKISANVIIYQFMKYLNRHNLKAKIPTEQTIYNWVAKKDHSFTKQWFIKLSKGLFGRNNHKKKQIKQAKIYHEKYLSINDLPEASILDQSNYYWELDTVEGKKSDQHVLLVMINRKTRRVIIKKVQCGAKAMLTKLIDVYHQYQLKIEGLIIDNGSENAYLHCFEELTKIYRCNPYNPTDKPRVENVNRLIRYWIPKSVSIDLFEEDQIQMIEDKINQYPRKVLVEGILISAYEYEELLELI